MLCASIGGRARPARSNAHPTRLWQDAMVCQADEECVVYEGEAACRATSAP